MNHASIYMKCLIPKCRNALAIATIIKLPIHHVYQFEVQQLGESNEINMAFKVLPSYNLISY